LQKADFAASFQRAAVGAIMKKLARALQQCGPVKSLFVGGGVSTNSRLRRELAAFAEQHQLDLRLPKMEYCLDNAAMIAGAAAARFTAGQFDGLTLAAAAQTEISAA
jgi:N6-L-threonylcarbamoyladenine synthase